MSNMVVNTNVLALNSHRSLKNVGTRQFRASARLSSGLRINSAADDAAGLGISEKMRAQIRGLDQASRNAQDGISLIQTAEGAMSTVNEMVIRIRELIVQAANDTNAHIGTNLAQSDRIRIQDEVNQLMDEVDATRERAQFNTRNLINGELAGPTIISNPGAAAMFNGLASFVDNLQNLNADQRSFITMLINQHRGYDVAGTDTMTTLGFAPADLTALGLNAADTIADLFTPTAFVHNTITDVNVANILGITFLAGTGGDLGAALGILAGGFDTLSQPAAAGAPNTPITAADLTQITIAGAGTMDLTQDEANALWAGAGNSGVATEADIQGLFTPAVIDALNAHVNALNTVGGLFGDGVVVPGGFNDAATFETFFNARFGAAAFTGVGPTEEWTAAARNLVHMLPAANVTFVPAGATVTVPGGGVPVWFQIGANDGQGVRLSIEDVGVARLSEIGVNGQNAAQIGTFTFASLRNTYNIDGEGLLRVSGEEITRFLTATDEALAHVTGQRSRLGAMQNRLEYTIQNLDISSENLQASESRIRDADMAREMMNLTKANVLQQAATSMLAQANQAPMTILQLLR